MSVKRNLIVTRHPGAVEWLLQRGVSGEVVASLDENDLPKGVRVYGVLPLILVFELLKRGNEVYIIQFPPRRVYNGQELTAEEMDKGGAKLLRFGLRQSCFCEDGDKWVAGAVASACNRCGQGYLAELALEEV